MSNLHPSTKQLLNYVISTLKKILSMEYIIYVKTQNFHWNVTGISFRSLHKLFEDQYKKSASFIDKIAEQIRIYGSSTPGSMNEFLTINSSVKNINEINEINEINGNIIKETDAVFILAKDNENIVKYINNIKTLYLDLGTQNLLGDLINFHLKNVWMLKAHL